MFGFGKQSSQPVYDITKRAVKTWWGGTKFVPTTKAEQRRMKAQILKMYPKATVIDSNAKKEKELAWIDRMEEFDAFMSD